MRFLHYIMGGAGVLVMLFAHSSFAQQANHISTDIRKSTRSQIGSDKTYQPSEAGDTLAEAPLGTSGLAFGVNVDDSLHLMPLLRGNERQENLGINAGFTYTDPTNDKRVFYFNYSMSGGEYHPILQDQSSQQAYYIDQQARLGIKIGF